MYPSRRRRLEKQMKSEGCWLCNNSFSTDYASWVSGVIENKDKIPMCKRCEALSKKSNPFLSMCDTDLKPVEKKN